MARAYTATTMMRDAMACLMDRWSRWCPVDGGGGEIRTRGGVTATRLFESRTLNRSDTPPGEDFTPTPSTPLKRRGRLGFLAGAMPGDFRPVAAAAHAAPLALPGAGGVLEDPVALRVLADPQPRGIALDQLAGERFREPGNGAVNRVSLVTVVERDAVGRRNQLIDVVRPQRPVHVGQGARVGRSSGGGRLQYASHRLADPAQPAQRLDPTGR